MGWGRKNTVQVEQVQDLAWTPPAIEQATIDWARLVTLDFETYFDDDYTLKKLSTSEYIRDARFKAQMVGIKIGAKPTKWYAAKDVTAALRAIPWATHTLLAHHAQFDAFILYHHYGISPAKIYDTLSMARALHNNDIGAGLDEVSVYYGGAGKIKDTLELTRGVRDWSSALNKRAGVYCVNDVDETLRIFKAMLPKMPAKEIELIDRICRMFTEPVLGVDRPRVEKELAREIAEKRAILLSFAEAAADIKLSLEDMRVLAKAAGIELPACDKKDLKAALMAAVPPEDVAIRQVKKLIGSEGFAELLRAEGVEPPVKVSPAYFKHRDETKKWTYAFSQTDMPFIELQEHESPRVRALVEARISVKSTTNETRAGRFLKASENGQALPVYLKYSAAHTHRLGGGDRMNMQNLKRGGELRRSIKAPKGHVIVVKDSGQIEARTNAWLWGQHDLLDDFRTADAFEARYAHLPKKDRPVARGGDRDAYCKFGDIIYGREIVKTDEQERFVGKVGVLGLGYQMGAKRFQKTLALGQMGPAVFLDDETCERVVRAYRKKNFYIKNGWDICSRIIEQMAAGISGSYKCIAWEKETIHLPNGMTMHYPELHDKRIVRAAAAKLTDSEVDVFDGDRNPDWPEYVYSRKGAETKIYGGLLCENIVQALARIIVMEQLLMISDKYRVVMTTHDENAAVVPIKQADKADAYMQRCMMTPPAWALDLPLNAEGGYDVVYSK